MGVEVETPSQLGLDKSSNHGVQVCKTFMNYFMSPEGA